MTEAEECFHMCMIQGRLISDLGTREKYITLPININSRSLVRAVGAII